MTRSDYMLRETVNACVEPELTKEEVRELADIEPQARDAFHSRIKKEWLTKIGTTTAFLYAFEYMIFSFNIWWVYLLPVLPILRYAHQLKWNRTTNYGALAAAKLAQTRDWPTWKRNTNKQHEIQKIKQKHKVK